MSTVKFSELVVGTQEPIVPITPVGDRKLAPREEGAVRAMQVPLVGQRILAVEDEVLISLDVEQILKNAGADVCSPRL